MYRLGGRGVTEPRARRRKGLVGPKTSGQAAGWTPPRRRDQLQDAFVTFLMTLAAIVLGYVGLLVWTGP